MDLFSSIRIRKSCRKYLSKPLTEDLLLEIKTFISQLEPLNQCPFTYRFESEVKGKFLVQAPHYLMISGSGQPGELENIGFLFEQLILWLDQKEIGSVWLGSAKAIEPNNSDIITIAFGYASEGIHRKESEFKRNPISSITNMEEDACIQAVRFTPSGMNLQPWYFEKHENKIHVYQKKLKLPMSALYKLSELDMGIALCHYYIACKHFHKSFHFVRKEDDSSKKGYMLFGEISCSE